MKITGLRTVAVDRFRRRRRFLLGELLRIQLVHDVRRGELSVPHRADEVVRARVAHVVGRLQKLRRFQHLGEVEVEALELAIEQVSADVDRPLALLLLDEVADARLRPGSLDEAEPVLVGPDVRVGEDLHRVHAGDVSDGPDDVVELLHVHDLDLERAYRTLLARARVGLDDVHSHVGEGFRELRQKALPIK